jgi:hypothetical protein
MIHLLLTINLLPSFLVRNFVRPARPIDQKLKKMQNKPNLEIGEITISIYGMAPYKNLPLHCHEKTNPIQTKSNPIYAGQAAQSRLRNYEILQGKRKGKRK